MKGGSNLKIVKLTENSIQVELSEPEMEKRSLNIGKLNEDAPAYKKLVEDMVSYAEIELGAPIGAYKVYSTVADNNSKISFVLESVSPDEIPVDQNSDFVKTQIIKETNKKKKEPVPSFTPAYGRNGGRSSDSASGEANSAAGSGPDIAAEFLRRMMIDGLLLMKSAILKETQNKNTDKNYDRSDGFDQSGDLVSGIRKLSEGSEPDNGSDAENDAPDALHDGVAGIFDTRRRLQFGDNYEEEGGIGLIAFASYNDLYRFLKANSGLDSYRSKLFEYCGVFYLQMFVGKKHTFRLTAIDTLAPEYRGVCIPASIALPILEEYGEVVFDKSAIKKIRESLG